MPENRGVSRREVLRIGAAGVASTALYDLLSGPALALGFAPVALAGLPLAFFLARRQRALAAQETEHEPHPS